MSPLTAAKKPTVEIAHILQNHLEDYKRQYRLGPEHRKILSDLLNCRTAKMGGRVDRCDTCGSLRIAYHSCRNRHCPKCQHIPRERGLAKRKEEILPVPYFHVVFTLPHELNCVILNHKRLMLNYLARYTHRVAIANSRIQSLQDGMVTFSAKNRKKNRTESVTISAVEFIRRFLLHRLPIGLVRIRHFGFLANRNRKAHLSEVRALLVIGPGRSIGAGRSRRIDEPANGQRYHRLPLLPSRKNALPCRNPQLLGTSAMPPVGWCRLGRRFLLSRFKTTAELRPDNEK